ncbi:glycoside hydrolase family 25 protein [Chelativorans sp. YIM 93263]|uniref:glycoside hydrolase family 25 protein n=1 Tax=Chelativorans sp. YIM 93263 TaxID=2906648 RepID=UPI002379380D|nr:GH25 family lysozyme [Chelativorans sp. YIM 93263]
MRISVIAFILLASLAVAGCSARSGVDALESVNTSPEVTSSIATVDAAVAAGNVNVEQIIQMTALAEPEHLNAPALEQVAMRVPPAPATRSQSNKIYKQRFSDAHPVNFGKVTPQHHPVHGVDVSRWQGEIDWQELRRQGANFAYIKATDGGDHVDPMFRKNWEAAHQAGIKRGAYHFFYWCRTAAEQADWFIRNVPKVKGALPPVLDVEYNHQSNCKRRWSTKDVREKMQVFMDRLERHYGQRPIIYTPPDFYADHLKGAFPNHPFWLRSVAAHPSKVYPGRDWVFWQYSGTGLSQGANGHIDLNVFRGDEKAWWRWVNQAAG